MYVTGGVTAKNLERIEGENSEFMKAYNDKGRTSAVLKTVPLFAVKVEDLGVRGALKVCIMEYDEIKDKESFKLSVTKYIVLVVTVLAVTVSVGVLLGSRTRKVNA